MISSSRLKKRNKKYSGFTFMELMIVIAIIGILSTISIVSFNQTRKRANVDTSADELASAISLAKEYSLQGKMPQGENSICGYGFRFTSTTEYKIFYYSDKTLSVTDKDYCKIKANLVDSNVSVYTQKLKTGVTLTSPNISSTKIYFNIPRADLSFSSAVNYTIKYTGSTSLTKTVSVNGAGLIETQ